MAKHENNGKCEKCNLMIYEGLLHGTLSYWFKALQETYPDVHLAHTYRGKEEQNKYFREGKSKAKFGQSPHNYIPCLAMDIFFLVNGKYNADLKRLKQIASEMPDGLTWGGSFKGFVDGVHFEKTNWKIIADNYPNGNKNENA